jgi:hypothetical protein
MDKLNHLRARALLYAVGGAIVGYRLFRFEFAWDNIALFALFILLPWFETCPVCGKSMARHSGGAGPNLYAMISTGQACPETPRDERVFPGSR